MRASSSRLRRPWRSAWLLVLLPVAGGIAGGGVAQLMPRTFDATAHVFVARQGITAEPDLGPDGFAGQLATTYAQVATTPLVLKRVLQDLGLHTTPQALAREITAKNESGTLVLGITVSDRSAARSAQIANAVSARLTDAVQGLTPSGPNAQQVTLTRLDVARARTSPSTRNLLIDVAVGAAAGLALALLGLLILTWPPTPPPGGRWTPSWPPAWPGEARSRPTG